MNKSAYSSNPKTIVGFMLEHAPLGYLAKLNLGDILLMVKK